METDGFDINLHRKGTVGLTHPDCNRGFAVYAILK